MVTISLDTRLKSAPDAAAKSTLAEGFIVELIGQRPIPRDAHVALYRRR